MSKTNKIILYLTFALSVYAVARTEYNNHKRLKFQGKITDIITNQNDNYDNQIKDINNNIDDIKNALLDLE